MVRFLLVLLAVLALASLRPETAQAQIGLAVVSADLNLRAGPGTRYQRMAVIPAGAPVDVISCASGWCRVNFDGHVGYVSERYLRFGAYAGVPYYDPPTVYTYRHYSRPYRYYYDDRRRVKRYHHAKPRDHRKHYGKRFSHRKHDFERRKFDRRRIDRRRPDRNRFRSHRRHDGKSFHRGRGNHGHERGGRGRRGGERGSWKRSSLTAPEIHAAYVGDRRIMTVWSLADRGGGEADEAIQTG